MKYVYGPATKDEIDIAGLLISINKGNTNVSNKTLELLTEYSCGKIKLTKEQKSALIKAARCLRKYKESIDDLEKSF